MQSACAHHAWQVNRALSTHDADAVGAQDLGSAGPVAATALLQALVPALLMNICIVGLNQLYDVEIDRVNKPYLPLASGELSERQGRWIVGVSGEDCRAHPC